MIPLLLWSWINSTIEISVNIVLNYDSNGFAIMKKRTVWSKALAILSFKSLNKTVIYVILSNMTSTAPLSMVLTLFSKRKEGKEGAYLKGLQRLSISYISVNLQRDIISTLTPAVSMSCLDFAFPIPAQTSVDSTILLFSKFRSFTRIPVTSFECWYPGPVEKHYWAWWSKWTNILQLSPTHLVFSLRHQHR